MEYINEIYIFFVGRAARWSNVPYILLTQKSILSLHQERIFICLMCMMIRPSYNAILFIWSMIIYFDINEHFFLGTYIHVHVPLNSYLNLIYNFQFFRQLAVTSFHVFASFNVYKLCIYFFYTSLMPYSLYI